MILLGTLLVASMVSAEPLEAPVWRAAVGQTQALVAAGDPRSSDALRVLRTQEVVDAQGNVYPVEDTMLGLLARELADLHAGTGAAGDAVLSTARHLALMESEANRLVTSPTPPFSATLRTSPSLAVTAPLPVAQTPSRLEPGLRRVGEAVRGWLGAAIPAGPQESRTLGFLLLTLGLTILALVFGPLLARRANPPATAQAPTLTPSIGTTPLGRVLLVCLDMLQRRALLHHVRQATNGEVLARLSAPLRETVAEAVRTHDQICYRERPATHADLRQLTDLQRGLERRLPAHRGDPP